MLSQKETKLLNALRSNARFTLKELSTATKLPISTVYEKIKRYEKNFIKRHSTILDFQKLGYGFRASYLLRTHKDSKEACKAFLQGCSQVNTLLVINNGYDFFVDVVFKNLIELQTFNETLEQYNIEEKKEFFVIEDAKTEGFLARCE